MAPAKINATIIPPLPPKRLNNITRITVSRAIRKNVLI
jgi:hypothetical protein